MVGPAQKREVISYLQDHHNLSQRKSCDLSNLSVKSFKYEAKISLANDNLKKLLIDLSNQNNSYGYRRLGNCLLRAGHQVNHKRVYRLYTELGLKIIKKKGKKIKMKSRSNINQVITVNDQWSIDFVSDRLTDGRSIRFLNIIDNYSRLSTGISVSTSLPSSKVIEILTASINKYGKPKSICLDNGPEFRSKLFQQWALKKGISLNFIQPGKPTQNAFIESFNGKFRTEFLDQHWFSTITEVKHATNKWRRNYNEARPHSALGYLTPVEFITNKSLTNNIYNFNCNATQRNL